jgi:hypothetical protein
MYQPLSEGVGELVAFWDRLHVDGRPSTEVARRPEALTEAVAE